MYYKLSEEELDALKKIAQRTMTNYEIQGDMFPMDSMYSLLLDVMCEFHVLDEKIEDLKEKKEQDLEEF